MGIIQELDAAPMRPWTGLQRKPHPRRAVIVVLAIVVAVGNAALVWWVVTHAIPDHEIRTTSASVRQAELPAGFDPAPLACDGAGLLCAWTDLEPVDAAAAVRQAVAERGVDIPEAKCGPGIEAPSGKFGPSRETAVQGVCIASSDRHGVALMLVANDEIPIGSRDEGQGTLPRTLVTLGWIYSATDRTVPGSPSFGDHQLWISEDELTSLPGTLGELRCKAGGLACHTAETVTASDDLSTDDFWALIDELAATGIRLDSATCEAYWCDSVGVMPRPAHPGESFLVLTNYTARDAGWALELKVWPTN